MEHIVAKIETTQFTSVALSVFVLNLFGNCVSKREGHKNSMSKVKEKEMGIIVLKVVCALLVLYIHVPVYQGEYSLYFWKIPSMFAVPFFFTCSGLLWERQNKTWRQVVKSRVFSNIYRYIIWVTLTIFYEIFVKDMNYQCAFMLYFGGIFGAKEYLIGMFWYMIVLIYGALVITILEYLAWILIEKYKIYRPYNANKIIIKNVCPGGSNCFLFSITNTL